MRLTRQVQASIRRAVREASGHRGPIELGMRDGTLNVLNWDDDADLQDTVRLVMEASWREVEGGEEGLVVFDCYLYATEAGGGGLGGNAYCLFGADGRTVLAAGSYHEVFVKGLPAALDSARAAREARERRDTVYAEARAVACRPPLGTGELADDTPLPIVADWLYDRDYYDLVSRLRAEIACDPEARLLLNS